MVHLFSFMSSFGEKCGDVYLITEMTLNHLIIYIKRQPNSDWQNFSSIGIIWRACNTDCWALPSVSDSTGGAPKCAFLTSSHVRWGCYFKNYSENHCCRTLNRTFNNHFWLVCIYITFSNLYILLLWWEKILRSPLGKEPQQLNMYEEKHWNLVKNKWPEVKALTL